MRGRIWRRKDAQELQPLWGDTTREAMSQEGSSKLLTACLEVGRPESIETRALTFEEQLEAVAAGRVRIAAVVPIRRADPDFTLGGVAW